MARETVTLDRLSGGRLTLAGRWGTRRRPLARAARWDGFFPIELPDPAALAQVGAELGELRGDGLGEFDLVAEIAPGEAAGPWAEAGATWVLTDFESQPRRREVEAAIDAGPGE